MSFITRYCNTQENVFKTARLIDQARKLIAVGERSEDVGRKFPCWTDDPLPGVGRINPL